MPIRLVDKDISKISYDAEIRSLRIRCEQNIIRSYDKEKLVYLVRSPKWVDGDHGEVELLASRYAEVLQQAESDKCQSVVLPLELHPRTFPRDKIYSIVVNAISDYLKNSELMVYLVVSKSRSFNAGYLLKDKLLRYLSEVYEPAVKRDSLIKRIKDYFKPFSMNDIQAGPDELESGPAGSEARKKAQELHRKVVKDLLEREHKGYIQIPESVLKRLNEMLEIKPEETFTEMMERLILEKRMKPSHCYKKANMDKRRFSKIKCDKYYHPQKETAIRLALALELDLEQTKEFLMKAGYALSHSDKRDVIVEFFIKEKQYNLMEIDGVLFEKGLKLLSNYD